MPTTPQLNDDRTNSFTTMAASTRVQYIHGRIKPWHTTLATMCILCHRQYVLQDLEFHNKPGFLVVVSEYNSMDNVFEIWLFLNLLDDNACLVDNLSTIPLTAAAF